LLANPLDEEVNIFEECVPGMNRVGRNVWWELQVGAGGDLDVLAKNLNNVTKVPRARARGFWVTKSLSAMLTQHLIDGFPRVGDGLAKKAEGGIHGRSPMVRWGVECKNFIRIVLPERSTIR